MLLLSDRATGAQTAEFSAIFAPWVIAISKEVRMSWGTKLLASAALFLPATPVIAQHPNLLPGAVEPGTISVGLKSISSGVLTAPVTATSAPGDPNDLFVVDQAGKIDVVHSGVLQANPFLDLTATDIPLNRGYDERGLLGLAFSPGFNDPSSPGFRTFYTYESEPAGTKPADFGPAPGTLTGALDHQNVLTQWKVSATNPNVVDLTSRRDLLREDHPALNHNGGTIAFGPDGKLYLAIGDGGTANDAGNGHLPGPGGNAQSLSVIMGKMIRIDPNGNNSANHQYGIPADNPFVNTPGAVKEIYAYGLRNPYKFSFDGIRLIEGDVGQNNVEEINLITTGGNYGWPIKEGTFLFHQSDGSNGANSPGIPPGLIDPILEYDHNNGSAVIGGFIYHGSLIPQLDGKYVFGDLSNGPLFGAPGNARLFYADPNGGQIFEFQGAKLSNMWLKGFGEDANGELYALGSVNLGPSGTTGEILQIVPEPTAASFIVLASSVLLARRRTRRACA